MPDIQKFLPVLCLAVYATAASIGAFVGGLWATLGIGLALIAFAAAWIMDRGPPLPSRCLTWLGLATLAVLAAEIPLSVHPDLSLKVWAQLASIFTPLLLLTAPRLQTLCRPPRFAVVGTGAAAVGAVALGIELLSGGFILHHLRAATAPLTDYNRGMAHLAILAFPLTAALWVTGRRKTALALAVVLLFPASLTESHTAKLALVAGAAGAVAACYRPIWVQRLLAALALAIMGWPFYAQRLFAARRDDIENWHGSWRHRIEIWDYLSYRIAERPWFGWGLGTTHTLDFTRPHGDLYLAVTTPAPHAHNLVTQLWVETGAVGLSCGLAFLMLSLRAAGRLDPSLRPFALGGWGAALMVAMFGFDFWTDALWAAFALAAFAFGMLQQQVASERDFARR